MYIYRKYGVLADMGIWLNFCRWSIVGANNGIQYGPFALPQNGLPIILSHKP